ncbi:hypothetical protein P7H62_14380 [Vagococcus carniphilus]|uniref:hypothetical protein n=1 Tax=Vagococcus carniphilus TaxID=218144 RepID=UPI002892595D|nr:hypothetical protein [Vagococcus carniphilus]MDT2830053.1 hypothetical protein [Vagococcus carniphilus]MDT2838487.1 hypothetical protein [Vagococcus carniphilus]MDT2855649.1 hypothetical protein [Vagococcus carniphilus]
MTQENKFEQIDYLTDELLKECNEKGLSFVLAISIDDETILASSGGEISEVVDCITILQEQVEDETEVPYEILSRTLNDECDCSGCKARRGEVKTENIPDDVLAKFLTALFTVGKEGGLDD